MTEMLRAWPQLRRLWPLLFILRWVFSLLTLCLLAHRSDWVALPQERRAVREHHSGCTTLSVFATATGFINPLYPGWEAMPLGFALCFSSRETCDRAVVVAFFSIFLSSSALRRGLPNFCLGRSDVWRDLLGVTVSREKAMQLCLLIPYLHTLNKRP